MSIRKRYLTYVRWEENGFLFSIMVYTDTSKGKFQSKIEFINPSNCINSQLFGTSFAHTCPVIGVTCGHLEWSVRMPRCTCRRVLASCQFKCEVLSCWLNLLWVQIFLGEFASFFGWIFPFGGKYVAHLLLAFLCKHQIVVNLSRFHGAMPLQLGWSSGMPMHLVSVGWNSSQNITGK